MKRIFQSSSMVKEYWLVIAGRCGEILLVPTHGSPASRTVPDVVEKTKLYVLLQSESRYKCHDTNAAKVKVTDVLDPPASYQ